MLNFALHLLIEKDFEARNGADASPHIAEGDIELTAEEMAIYKESGMDGLVWSEAWRRSRIIEWPRVVPYQIASNIGTHKL